jgi:hypothetical protein
MISMISPSLMAREAPAPVFDGPAEAFTESGYLKLSWHLDVPDDQLADYTFELQQSEDPAFSDPLVIYQGPDLATFLSGLPDGTFHYRIRAIGPEAAAPGRWSSPVVLEVKHHSLRLALLLFGLGAVVFLLTVGIVMQGHRSTTTR